MPATPVPVIRLALAGLFVLLAGALVVRTAVVRAFADNRPLQSEWIWPDHPDVVRSITMAQIGSAAGQGRLPAPSSLAGLEALQRAEPLSVEPLLVHAAMAQRDGDLDRAEALAVRARAQDPRSLAARYLLADLLVRTGRMGDALKEMAVFARLVPRGMLQFVPALSDYLVRTGDIEGVAPILAGQDALRSSLLAFLSRDAANADLVLSLHRPTQDGTAAKWQAGLVDRLLADGRSQKAYATWLALTGARPPLGRGLSDPDFAQTVQAPFGWVFTSGKEGVVEPEGDGLRILYYGRKDSLLAKQVLMLEPGAYRLSSTASGTGSGPALAWRMTCLGKRPTLGEIAFPPGGGPAEGTLSIPAQGCPVQRLALHGLAAGAFETVDARIAGLRLEKVAR